MIDLGLARRLQRAGVAWTPTVGDRFLVPDRDLDDQVFTVSDMVVEVRRIPTGTVLAFNGTTEWALDSIEQRMVVWLPREDQLRELLGPAFVGLERSAGGFVVRLERGRGEERYDAGDVEDAYATALLATLAG